MRATKTLPVHYQKSATIRLTKNSRLLILLSVAGVPLFCGASWLVVQITLLLRPDATPLMHVLEVPGNGGGTISLPLPWIGGVLLACFLVPLLHETVHGACFWLVTHDCPRFAYKVWYASAAAPAWYIPRNPYVLVGLAPLGLLSLLGVGLLPLVPQLFIPLLIAFLVLNTSGTVGDIAVVGWLLVQPGNLLARDTRDAITLSKRQKTERYKMTVPSDRLHRMAEDHLVAHKQMYKKPTKLVKDFIIL